MECFNLQRLCQRDDFSITTSCVRLCVGFETEEGNVPFLKLLLQKSLGVSFENYKKGVQLLETRVEVGQGVQEETPTVGTYFGGFDEVGVKDEDRVHKRTVGQSVEERWVVVETQGFAKPIDGIRFHWKM